MSHESKSHELNDYRSTAYVLGEMSPAETAAFECELEQSAELRAEVQAIGETVNAVQAEFASATVGVGAAGRRRIEGAIAGSTAVSVADLEAANLPTDDNSTNHTWLIAIAIAASLLLVGSLAIPAFMQPPRVAVNDPLTASDPVSPQLPEGQDDVLQRERGSELAREWGNQAGPDSSSAVEALKRPELAAKTDGLTESRSDFDRDVAKSSVTAQPAGNVRLGDRSLPGQASGVMVESEVEQQGPPSLAAPSSKSDFAVSNTRGRKYADAARGLRRGGEVAGESAIELGQTDSKGFGIVAPGDQNRSVGGMAMRFSGDAANGAKLSETEARNRGELPDNRDGYSVTPESKPTGFFYSAADGLGASVAPAEQAEKAKSLHRRKSSESLLESKDAATDLSIASLASGKSNIANHVDESILMSTLPDEAFGAAGDRHEPISDNPFLSAVDSPLSTFSIDVDTAAYAKVRMYLMQQNSLPRPEAVRIEEMLNYFSYDYSPPTDEHPFAATVAVAQCPWNSAHRLARVALKGKVIEEDRPASNLVFLLDVSGSMNKPNKHPFVVAGMKMLTKQLTENDQVAIVVYAGAAGLVLDSTCGDEQEVILRSLDRLRAGGSTNGAQGIQLAYQTARDNFIVGGTNRVILCTDGDFNVGVTNTDELVKIAEENAKGNIFLSVLGFGMGNHNDAMMEQISNKGNGNYAFIDSEREAQKVLVEQMGGTLVTIAKDVKVQIEFNSAEVAAYRLIGYENRMLAAQDFNDDTKDAGEIGAGHTVTALYELVPAKGQAVGDVPEIEVPEIDELRYRRKAKLSKHARSGELLTLKLRYKQPTGSDSTLVRLTAKDSGKPFAKMDKDFKFAAAVASFGMMLRNSPHKGNATFAGIEEMVPEGIGADRSGRRQEFLQLVTKAKQLSGEN